MNEILILPIIETKFGASTIMDSKLEKYYSPPFSFFFMSAIDLGQTWKDLDLYEIVRYWRWGGRQEDRNRSRRRIGEDPPPCTTEAVLSPPSIPMTKKQWIQWIQETTCSEEPVPLTLSFLFHRTSKSQLWALMEPYSLHPAIDRAWNRDRIIRFLLYRWGWNALELDLWTLSKRDLESQLVVDDNADRNHGMIFQKSNAPPRSRTKSFLIHHMLLLLLLSSFSPQSPVNNDSDFSPSSSSSSSSFFLSSFMSEDVCSFAEIMRVRSFWEGQSPNRGRTNDNSIIIINQPPNHRLSMAGDDGSVFGSFTRFSEETEAVLQKKKK